MFLEFIFLKNLVFCSEKGLSIGPSRTELRSVPEAVRLREQVENHRRSCTQVLFLRKAELGFFHFFINGDRLAITFRSSEDPSTAGLVPSIAKDPACCENWFFHAGKGAENIKEKSR
jgi:hypothetical protein